MFLYFLFNLLDLNVACLYVRVHWLNELCGCKHTNQRAKKVVSNSPRLVDFAIGLESLVFNLPNGQVMFIEEFELQKNCEINSASQKVFGDSWNDVWANKW